MSSLRFLAAAAALVALLPTPPRQGGIGYDDTPFLPGSRWRVHDGERPQPRVVRPGRRAADPPSDAVILFDGKGLSAWKGRHGAAGWKVEDGTMEVTRTGAIETKASFGDCQLHIEWRTPTPPRGHGQGRGNSGVFLMGRYEVQVLDSDDNPTYPDGQAGAIYGQCPPLVNACRGPGEWQTYDIVFDAPRFTGGKLAKPAYLTVIHNGVVVHHHRKILGPTRHRKLAAYVPHAPEGPILLQDHGDPVRFRNIWVRRLGRYDGQ